MLCVINSLEYFLAFTLLTCESVCNYAPFVNVEIFPVFSIFDECLTSIKIQLHYKTIRQKPLTKFRYSEATQTTRTVTQPVQDLKKPTSIGAGKKVKNVAKPSTSIKVNQHLTLRTESEDTCNSDDFSSFYQSNGTDCK